MTEDMCINAVPEGW